MHPAKAIDKARAKADDLRKGYIETHSPFTYEQWQKYEAKIRTLLKKSKGTQINLI